MDDLENLKQILDLLIKLSEKRKVIFPVHPRTRNNISKHSLNQPVSAERSKDGSLITHHSSLIITDPIGYIDFIALIKNAELIITDSGGIQEESTYLGVQCITLRDSTERPITVEVGTNQLLGTDLDKALEAALKVLDGNKKEGKIPEKWEGHAAERIVKILVDKMS